MTAILHNLQAVRARIERAAFACGRSSAEIGLLAVSKTFPARYIQEAFTAGQKAFGESYAQEAEKKILDLSEIDPEWHFIGPIQSNKTALIAERFAWVHSIEREKIAVRLNAARPEHLPPLQVCIQINVSDEVSKSGIAPGQELGLARCIADLPRLRLRGLMAIPEPTSDLTLQRRRYARVHELAQGLIAQGYPLDTLSMGMSDDLESAIAEGATLVRVGTAIFGRRETLLP